MQITMLAQTIKLDSEKWPHVYNTKDFKFGIIDDMGNEILPPQYNYIQDFDRQPKSRVFPSYEQLDYTMFRDSTNKVGILNKEGNVVFQPIDCQYIYHYFQMDSLSNEKYAVFLKDRKHGLINEKGEIILPPRNGRFHGPYLIHGLAPVLLDRYYGYIDISGELIIPNHFNIARPFFFGKAWVFKNSGWGLINEKGDLIIDYKYEDVKPFNKEGLAAVKLNDKWGFINEADQLIIEFKFNMPRFNEMRVNNRILYGFQQDSTYGLIDRSGNVVFEPKFRSLRRFDSSGLAGFSIDGKWGFIDTLGVVKILPVYEEVFPFHESEIATVYDGESYWLINRKGVKTAGPFSIFILPFRESNIAVFQKNRFSKNEQGLVDMKGNIILDLIPAKITGFRNLNYSKVLFGDRVGLVNRKGDFFGFDMQDVLDGGVKVENRLKNE